MENNCVFNRIAAVVTAVSIIASLAALSGCSIKGHSPEDDYRSPFRTDDQAKITDLEYSSVESESDLQTEETYKSSESDAASEKNSEDKKESKAESKAESKVESKTASKVESKAASKVESKAESKVESKAESKTESTEEKKDDSSPLYKDMESLIKDGEAVGYTICKLLGSDEEHLVIAYGGVEDKKDNTESGNVIIIDPEAYAKEQAEKALAENDEREASRLYSIYKIDSNRVVPEGDIDGYYTTAYISANTNTLALYYAREDKWKLGLIVLNDGSASVDYSEQGSLADSGAFPAMPGAAVSFSDPNKLDLIKKYK